MSKSTKNTSQKHAPTHPLPAEQVSTQQQKAESLEVAGRHRNAGQKDHKGAR
jgi:hypothetical protein